MRAKKSFGQNFLQDQSIVAKIIDAAGLSPKDVVVEVGPGQGALTKHLAGQVKRLILIEADRDLIEPPKKDFPEAEIYLEDAAKADYAKFVSKGKWKLVSNLPYNSANAILRQVLTSDRPPELMVIMVQREVGDKLMAKPGDMSLLSVAVQVYAQVARVTRVMPGAFIPAPKVESVVLKLEPRPPQPPLQKGGKISAGVDKERVIALAKVGFAKKRKQLHKNLADAGVCESSKTKKFLSERGLTEQARAEDLSLDDWIVFTSQLMANS